MMRFDLLVNHVKKACLHTPEVAVAMSGGVDSGLVAAAAFEALGERCMGITVHSELTTERDLDRAVLTAGYIGLRHHVVTANMLDDFQIRVNQDDRCYHCKRKVFIALKEMLVADGVLIDGTNADDDPARPGLRAVREFEVLSPLKAMKLGKAQVREVARGIGLPFWDARPESCLATRVATGVELTTEALDKVKLMESFFHDRGIKTLRVYHDNLMASVVYMSKYVDIVDKNRDSFAALIKRIGLESCVFKEWTK